MKYDLRKIMLAAWRLFHKLGLSFAECLHRAWLSAKDRPRSTPISERVHLITAEGIRQFEASRTGPTRRDRAVPQRKRRARRPNPGPI